jgi:hypothetical protein
MREKPTNTPIIFIQFINYIWYLLHVSALHCHLQGSFLVPSERCSTEEQSTKFVDGRVVSSDVQPQYSLDCATIEHLSEGTRNAP